MSLLDEFKSTCAFLEKTHVPDGEGGFLTDWTEGAKFLAAVVLNIILNYALIGSMAHKGLALATSLSSIVTVISLMISLRRKIGRMGWRSLFISGIKMLVGTAVMLAAAKGAYWGVETLLKTESPLLPMMAAACVGVVVYVVVLLLLRTREMAQLIVGAYQAVTRRKPADI